MKGKDKTKEQLQKELKAMKEWVINQEFVEYERKKAEEAQRESEKRFEDIAMSSADWIWEVDRDGRYTYASGKVKEILGYEPEELIGKTVFDLMPEEEAKRVGKRFREIAKKRKKLSDSENRILTKDGKIIWVVTNGVPIKDKQDKFKGYRGVTKDITEHKLADEQMRFLQFSVEHTEEAAYWMGPDARFIYVNDAACRSLGYSRSELLKMTVHDIDPDFPKDVWPSHWEEVKRRGHFLLESRHKTKDGKIFPVEISVNFLEFEDNEYNFAFARDITERKAAEVLLKEGEARMQQIINQMPYPIEVCAPDGTATLVNQAFLDMMGIPSTEIVVGNYNVFKDPYIEGLGLLPEIKRVYNGESVFLPNVKAPLEKIDDKHQSFKSGNIYFEVTMFPVLHPSGDLWRVVTIWKDVTAQKIAEKHLIDERNRAELYLEVLSHDIININQAIMSSNELLLLNSDLPDDFRKYVKTSLSQATAMADLINNVKKLSKLNMHEFTKKKIDVHSLLDKSIETINRIYPDHRIEIKHTIPKSKIYVSGNELLQDVFDNILFNAVKYNQNSNVIVDISHSKARKNSFWKIEIKDNGPGIPDEMKKVLFKRLERGVKSVRGSGLGLTIVNEIVNRCGGKVWVEDRVSGNQSSGSNFVVMLPKKGK